MSDANDLELAVRIRVEGQQALDGATRSTQALGASAKTESASVDQLLAAIKGLTAEVNLLTAALPAAGSAMARAGSQTRTFTGESMQAQQALRGLGAEIGVAMPRYVSRFLVSLGPVAGALSAAFSVVAVVGILEMLPKLYQAVEDFGAKLGGVTERSRKQLKELVEQQDKLQMENLGNAEKLRDLNTAGVEGSAKTALQMRNMTAAAKDYGVALGEAMKQLEAAKAHEASFSIWSPGGDKKRAEAEVDRLQAKVEKLQEDTRKRLSNSPEFRSLQAERGVKIADEHRADQLQQIEGAKSMGLAMVSENEKTIKQLRELRVISEADETAMTKQQADDRLRVEKSAAQAAYDVKSRQPGANKALLKDELKDQQQAAQQRADAAKQGADLEAAVRNRAGEEAMDASRRASGRELADVSLQAAKGFATRASAQSARTIALGANPGREVDAAQATYNEAIKLADQLQKKEQDRIDKELAAEEERIAKESGLADAQHSRLQQLEAAQKAELDRQKLIADISARRDEARIAAEEKVAELQKKRLDEAKGEAGSLFDAIHGGGAGVQKYLVNMAEQLEKGIFTNLMTGGGKGGAMSDLLNNVHNATPGQRNADGSNTFLGGLLQDTILGQRTPGSALKTQGMKSMNSSSIKFDDVNGSALSPDVLTRKDNTVALGVLDTSVTQLTMVLQGKQPSLMNGAVVPTAVMGVPGSVSAMEGAVGNSTTVTNTTSVGGSTTTTITNGPAGSAAASGGSSPASSSSTAPAGSTSSGSSPIASLLALTTLGAGLAAAAMDSGSPAIRVVSGPGKGVSGDKSSAVTGLPEFTTPQIVAMGATAASVGFGALTKAGVFKADALGGTALGSSVGDFAGGFAKGASGGVSGVVKGWNDPDTSWSDESGQIAGTAAAAYTGVTAAIKGFSKGTGQGTAQGIAAVAGTAAGLDPEPISKGILSTIAVVSSMVGTIMGDPKANRQRAITNALEAEAYVNSPTVNGTQALDGNNMSFNKYGKLQMSPFAGYSVTDPSTYQNQLTGQYFTTPGSVSSSDYVGRTAIAPSQLPPAYRAASTSGGNTVHLTINALDTQSIMNRSGDIGMAVYKELNAGGALGLRIQQTVLGA